MSILPLLTFFVIIFLCFFWGSSKRLPEAHLCVWTGLFREVWALQTAQEASAAGRLDSKSAKVVDLPWTQPEQAKRRTRTIWLMLFSSCVFKALWWRGTGVSGPQRGALGCFLGDEMVLSGRLSSHVWPFSDGLLVSP